MMKHRYLLLLGLVVFWVVADIGTKTLAEQSLASHTSRWQHSIYRDVLPQHDGLAVQDWCVQALRVNLDHPGEARCATSVFRQGEERPEMLFPQMRVRAGETLEVRHRQTTVVPGFWNHIYVQNFGAAWGMMGETDERFRRPFFFLISLVAVAVVGVLFRNLRPDQLWMAVALASIVGGAAGNFIDRVRYGYVVDFIQWYVTVGGRDRIWPTFNVADVAIFIGVAMMMIELLFFPDKGRAAEAAAPSADPPPVDV
jgi:lipoprotein signal peptidase